MQRAQLVNEITYNALTLVQDPYGNYVRIFHSIFGRYSDHWLGCAIYLRSQRQQVQRWCYPPVCWQCLCALSSEIQFQCY